MTDDRFARDLARLVPAKRTIAPLPTATAPAPVLGKTGLGTLASTASSGQSLASPLTETAYADREHYDAETITSSDGLFTFTIRRLKVIKFTDANSAAVELQFSEPAT